MVKYSQKWSKNLELENDFNFSFFIKIAFTIMSPEYINTDIERVLGGIILHFTYTQYMLMCVGGVLVASRVDAVLRAAKEPEKGTDMKFHHDS